MLAVLDANVLIADFRLESNALNVLLAEGAAAGITVGIPEVVMREANRKLRQELEQSARRLDKLSRDLRRTRTEITTTLDIDGTVAEYETKLRELTNLPNWTVLPWPDANHADVLARLHGGGAPASGDGSGYQDILIWETLLAALDRHSVILLVSSDKDFAEAEGNLDPGLRTEAESRHPGALVRLAPTLKELVDDYITTAPLDGFSVDKDRQYEFEEALAEHLTGRLLEPGVRHAATPGAEEAWISTVTDMSDIELHGARKLPNGEIAMQFLADVYVRLESDWAETIGITGVETVLAVRADIRCLPDAGPPTYIGLLDVAYSG